MMQQRDNLARISVIIPTYNRADFIAETIQSVLDQTYPAWEIVVLDDGSTDNTAEVVAQFGEPVKYVCQKNAGETAARSAGFYASQGDFVSFLDSDDRMLPHNLESLMGLLQARPEVDVAYGWYYWMDKQGQPLIQEEPKIKETIPAQLSSPWPDVAVRPSGPTLEGKILPKLVLEETMLMGSVLIRRACVEAVGAFDPAVNFQGHWDFFLRVARAGYTYACCRQGIVVIRLHSGNRGKDQEAMLANRLMILDRLFDSPELKDKPAELREQAYYQAYLTFALIYYATNHFDQGTSCLDKALTYGSLQPDDLMKVTESIAHPYVTNPEVKDPLQAARRLFETMHLTPQVRRLRGKVLGQINAALAFRRHQTGEGGQVWRHALGAVINDPSWLRNRGLARITLEEVVSPKLVDQVRSRRFPASNELLETVAQTTNIFISPHFDDAVLSCGGTLAHLAQHGADILLVTVFTADLAEGSTVPPLAWELHEKWGEAKYPFRLRGVEEQKIAERLGAKYLWLDLLDAMYRYPTMTSWEEQFRPDFEPKLDLCFEEVRARLLKVIEQHPGATVFAPLGLGYHRDHLIVHQALEDIKQTNPANNRYYFYEDYPYAAGADIQKRLEQLEWPGKALTIDITATLEERVELIKMYPSQLSMLFENADNVYKAVEAYATRVGVNGKPRERFWSDPA